MNKVIVPWKAYPMDRMGVKSPRQGQVEVLVDRLILNELHDAAVRQVYETYPELRSTPLIIGKFHKEAA